MITKDHSLATGTYRHRVSGYWTPSEGRLNGGEVRADNCPEELFEVIRSWSDPEDWWNMGVDDGVVAVFESAFRRSWVEAARENGLVMRVPNPKAFD